MTGTGWMPDILALELDARTKGIPLAVGRVRLGDVGKQGWNVLRGDLMFPVLILRDGRMRQNLRVLRDFAQHHQVDLAPHGKSTMAPQLYQDQRRSVAPGGSRPPPSSSARSSRGAACRT